MEVEGPELSERSAPGQFVNVLVSPGVTDPFLRVPLGIHRIKKSGIALLYKVVGSATTILSQKKEGDEINVLGPLGNGFTLKASRKGKGGLNVLVAGGHGIAPLYALAEALLKKQEKVLVFIGASSKKFVPLSSELKKEGCEVKIATDDGSSGKKGYVTSLLREYFDGKPPEKNTKIYACGPSPMLEELSRMAAAEKVRAQVSVDSYMACGTGVCRGCAVMTVFGYKQACKDGPVFYSDEIIW